MKRYKLTTAKGSTESDTLAAINTWQCEHQGAFTSLEDRHYDITVSVDEIDFTVDGSSLSDIRDALITFRRPFVGLGGLQDLFDTHPNRDVGFQ